MQQSNPLRLPEITMPVKEPNTIQLVRTNHNNNDNLNTENTSQTKMNIPQEKRKEGDNRYNYNYNYNENEGKKTKERISNTNLEPVLLKKSGLNSVKKIAQLPDINAKEFSVNHININIKKSTK